MRNKFNASYYQLISIGIFDFAGAIINKAYLWHTDELNSDLVDEI